MTQRILPDLDHQDIEITYVSRSGEFGTAWSVDESPQHLPRVEAIWAFWGVTRGDAPTLAQNTSLAIEAINLAKHLGAQTVLHCSSAAVYTPSATPLTETAAKEPAGAYGQAKLAMETAIAAHSATIVDPPRSVMMRIGNVAGAESLFGNMRPGGHIYLDQFDDGTGPRRSYLAPHEFLRVCLALTNTSFEGPINVAAPVPTRMQDLVVAGDCNIIWQPAPAQAIQSLTVDTSLLSSLCPLSLDTADPGYLVQSARDSGVWP